MSPTANSFHPAISFENAGLLSQNALRAALFLVRGKESASGTVTDDERRALVSGIASGLMPDPASEQSLALSLSSNRAAKDLEPSALMEMSSHLALMADRMETIANQALHESTSFPSWNDTLTQLAAQYSYVLEAAQSLVQRGVVSLRAHGEMINLLDEPVSGVGALDMHTKAWAILQERQQTSQPSMRMV